MKKWFKDWTPLPADMIIHMLLPIVAVVFLYMLLPLSFHIRRGEDWGIFRAALGVAVIGVILLSIARLPLYRRRQFFAFGPRLLDATHRRLYWAAYVLIGVSVLLLLALFAAL